MHVNQYHLVINRFESPVVFFSVEDASEAIGGATVSGSRKTKNRSAMGSLDTVLEQNSANPSMTGGTFHLEREPSQDRVYVNHQRDK
ncbi:hypothetical protein DESC_600014 [Desulfosarcina cetonica]|uniref:hypothetical protein n=1 Tax=Desulfosarcina cetonica TaxID=90730 RepID=UPI0012ED8D56|nr:hypothetical protein [Desulfosarcina cetonica]VTR67300.1 hypothetical protein DESC_600014 [Desulfosarcina cetonica]